MLNAETLERQQPVFAALAAPVRRNLLLNLAENSPRTATQLAEEYPMTRQGLLKHLTILEEAGLVAVRQVGREKRYLLQPEPLNELEQWMEALGKRWEQRLLRLKAMIEEEGQQAPE